MSTFKVSSRVFADSLNEIELLLKGLGYDVKTEELKYSAYGKKFIINGIDCFFQRINSRYNKIRMMNSQGTSSSLYSGNRLYILIGKDYPSELINKKIDSLIRAQKEYNERMVKKENDKIYTKQFAKAFRPIVEQHIQVSKVITEENNFTVYYITEVKIGYIDVKFTISIFADKKTIKHISFSQFSSQDIKQMNDYISNAIRFSSAVNKILKELEKFEFVLIEDKIETINN